MPGACLERKSSKWALTTVPSAEESYQKRSGEESMGIMCRKCGDTGGPWAYVEDQGFICEDCLGGGGVKMNPTKE